MFRRLLKHYKVKPKTPWKKLPADFRRVLLRGSGKNEFKFKWEGSRSEYHFTRSWEGILPHLERRYHETSETPAGGVRAKFWPSTRARPARARG